jgi:PAS domain S-box-containing protein
MAAESQLSLVRANGQAARTGGGGSLFPPAVAGVLRWMHAAFQPAKATATEDGNAEGYVFRVEQGSPSPTLLIAHAVLQHSIEEIIAALECSHVAARLRSDPMIRLRCVEQGDRIAVAQRPSWRGPPPGERLALPALRDAAADPLHVAAEIVEALPEAVVVAGLDRRVLVANSAAARLFGWRLDDLLCTSLDNLVAPGQRQQVAERERRALRGEAQRYDFIVVRADGQECQVGAVTTRLVLEGQLIGTVATLCDGSVHQPSPNSLCIPSRAGTA